jgi:cytochrome c-type biogenesis protein CcmH/NrfG
MKEFDYDMINRYLNGEMNGEELKAFELQMQQDADLQKEVELLKDVNSTLKIKLHPGENETALRNALQEMNAEFFASKAEQAKVIPLNRRKWMTAIAAVFVLALLLTLWQPWKKEDLYKQYADIQMPAIAQRGATTDSLLKQAVENFNNKKFAEAIPVFETVLKDTAENSFVQYYYAIALLQNGNIEKARAQLTVLYNGESIFKNDAAFYLALSYLKEKNKDTCKDWLHKIPTDNATWFKAQELLKKL